MNYLYHMIPINMQKNILYPLNNLKEINPKIYKEYKKKYKGKEHLLKLQIPFLNCLWNDAIHLTAVNPKDIKRELINFGSKSKFDEWSWYKIHPNNLIKEKAIIFLYKDRENERILRNNTDNFIKFNIPALSKISKIPIGTINYYKSEIENGNRPLLFHLVPHILYKGSINIKNCEVIKL